MISHETQCFYRKKAAPLSSHDSKAAGTAHNMKLISALTSAESHPNAYPHSPRQRMNGFPDLQ